MQPQVPQVPQVSVSRHKLKSSTCQDGGQLHCCGMICLVGSSCKALTKQSDPACDAMTRHSVVYPDVHCQVDVVGKSSECLVLV